MANATNPSTPSKALDGISESTDMYWHMFANNDKRLQQPNIVDHLSPLSEEASSQNSDTAHEPAAQTQPADAAVVEEPVPLESSQAPSLTDSGDTADSASHASADDEDSEVNPVLDSLSGKKHGGGSFFKSDTKHQQPASGSFKNRAHAGGSSVGDDSRSAMNGGSGGGGASSASATEHVRVAKFEMLSKLLDLKNRGVVLSQNYTIDSPYDVMEREYKVHYGLRNKNVVISIYEQAFFSGLNIFQFLNETYNPFNFKLAGFSKSVRNDIDLYRDIFGDFYELYHKDGKKIHPMIRLGLAMGNTMIGSHISNSRLETEAAEKERVNKYIQDQIKIQVSAATAAVANQFTKSATAAPSSGQPSYQDLQRANEALIKQQSHMNANMSRVMETLASTEKRMQAMSGGAHPPPQPSQQQQQRPPNQPQPKPIGQSPRRPQAPPPQDPTRLNPSHEQKRFDDYMQRRNHEETMQRHRIQLNEQDKHIARLGSHGAPVKKKAVALDVYMSSDDDDDDDDATGDTSSEGSSDDDPSDSDSDDRQPRKRSGAGTASSSARVHAVKHKQRRNTSTVSSDASSSSSRSRNSRQSSVSVPSRNSKGGKKKVGSIKIDTEQVY